MRRAFFNPHYWPIWFLLGIVRLAVHLPYSLQLSLGRGLGALLRLTARRRWRITLVNLERCFPELDAQARERLARRHFDSLGMAFIEIGMCWWASAERLKGLAHIEGVENLNAPQPRAPLRPGHPAQ